MHPGPCPDLHLHVLAGRERAGRKRGRRFRCIRGRVTGRGWRQFFGNAPDLHTPLCGFGGARKGTANRRSTQRPISGCHLSLAGESSAQGNDEGGRADGSKPINGNPAAGKNSRAPAVFCHTVDIYSKKTLRAGLILHPTPVTMTSLTPYKVADAVGPDGQRLGGAVGLATYRATHGKRVACLSKGSHVTFGKKKRSKGDFILLSGANLG